MPNKDTTMLVKNVESTAAMKQNTASGNRVQPWKAFLKRINDGTAIAKIGADDMIYQFKNGMQDNEIAS